MAQFLVAHGDIGKGSTRIPAGLRIAFLAKHGEELPFGLTLSWIHGRAKIPAPFEIYSAGDLVHNYTLEPSSKLDNLYLHYPAETDNDFTFLGATGAPDAESFCTCTPSTAGKHDTACKGLFGPGVLDGFDGFFTFILCRGDKEPYPGLSEQLLSPEEIEISEEIITLVDEGTKESTARAVKKFDSITDNFLKAYLSAVDHPGAQKALLGKFEEDERELRAAVKGKRQSERKEQRHPSMRGVKTRRQEPRKEEKRAGISSAIALAGKAAMGSSSKIREKSTETLEKAAMIAREQDAGEIAKDFATLTARVKAIADRIHAHGTALSPDGTEKISAEMFLKEHEHLISEKARLNKIQDHIGRRPDRIDKIYSSRGIELGTLLDGITESIDLLLQDANYRKIHTAIKHSKATDGLERDRPPEEGTNLDTSP
ncbi:hypothetical protein OHV05_35245 (plasmid) [Kitasatospora sp. NBC_00070]|uniref:putative adhesin n=1 Tax=Kitasatospora sp. NBC_00070 TaxID=2975962 RepID=UPI002F912CD7